MTDCNILIDWLGEKAKKTSMIFHCTVTRLQGMGEIVVKTRTPQNKNQCITHLHVLPTGNHILSEDDLKGLYLKICPAPFQGQKVTSLFLMLDILFSILSILSFYFPSYS